MSHPNKQPPARVYAEALESYYQLGWNGILPLPVGQKSPPPEGFTGWTGDWPSYADLYAWAEERPGANVGLRMPEHVIGIDVDNYSTKTGGETLAAKEAEWGTLPPTWRSTSRDDGVSGIRFYSIPTGLEWVTGLPSIELIHFGHRYAVVAPSIHPEGRPYRWIDPDGNTSLVNPSAHDMPPLPAAWILGLAKGPHVGQARADLDNDAAWTWIQALPGHNAASCTFMAEWAAKAVREMGETRESRHDVTRGQVLKLVRFAESGHRGIEPALDRIRAAFIRLVIGDNSRTMREASSEWGRILTGAVRIIVANPEPSVVEGDPCPPVMAKLGPVPSSASSAPRREKADEPTPTASPAKTENEVLRLLMGSSALSDEPPVVSEASVVDDNTWRAVVLGPYIRGEYPESPPIFLARTDGVCLFYPGRINGILGVAEAGKTWVALETVRQAIAARAQVLYLDFEDTPSGIVARLQALGVSDADLETYLTYLNPDQRFGEAEAAILMGIVEERRPVLIFVDGVNAAMSLNGLDLMDNKDATVFAQMLLKPLARTGACVVTIDHLPKNNNTEAKGGIGAQAKRAMITGCAIRVDVMKPFGRGQHGELLLTVDKDRAGHVRGQCTESTTIGTAHLDSDGITWNVALNIEPAAGAIVTRRVTTEQQRMFFEICEKLRQEGEPVSGNKLEAGVVGTSAKIRQAAVWLRDEGYIAIEKVHGTNWHTLIRPYGTTSSASSEVRRDEADEGANEGARPGSSAPSQSGADDDEPGGDLEKDLHQDQQANQADEPRTQRRVGVTDDGDYYDIGSGEMLTQDQADQLMEGDE